MERARLASRSATRTDASRSSAVGGVFVGRAWPPSLQGVAWYATAVPAPVSQRQTGVLA